MKKDIKEFIKSAKKWKKSTQILFALIFFMAASFGAISLLGMVAISDWYFNHRAPQSMSRQFKSQDNKTEALVDAAKMPTTLTQETKEIISTKQSVSVKSNDASAETTQSDMADAENIKQLAKQAKEYEKQTKESLDSLNKTLSQQVITPPVITPIVVPDIDTTITTQPIDGTIKPTNRPADVCASSAAKFLPECK